MIEITAHIDNHRLAEILSTDEFMDPIKEALVEGVTECVLESDALREAAMEAGSEAGSEAGNEAGSQSGQESGWEAGREAAQEAVADGDGGITWGDLQRLLSEEVTDKSMQSGCAEWRAYFDGVDWAIKESIRNEVGALHFLKEQADRGVGAQRQDVDWTAANDNGLAASLNQRVQDLELLVAGLGTALGDSTSVLRSYADTAQAHVWPAWMADCSARIRTA